MAGVSKRNVLEQILNGRMKPTDLELSLLKDMTNRFSEDRKIGQGRFGIVYKGFLGNRTVAVKRIINPCDEKQFNSEVRNLIDVDQENVVRFLGYCSNKEETLVPFNGTYVFAERIERLLCLEYIGNGSLDKYITDELRGLEWNIRCRIIKGIFEGLHYLHKEKGIIHMDLKPQNILMDDHMVPKITDFGLSRLENSETTSTQRLFTLGYCAPEYQFQGKMSLKSDMYSLGVIIVELVTGQKDIPNINNVLRRWRNRWNASARVTPLECTQITKCIEIGLLCLKVDPSERPSIGEIIEDVRKLEYSDGHVISDEKSIVGQVSASYSNDEMLRIEPLELHFSFKHNKETSCPIHLTNETDSYISFYIETESSLRYNIEPEKGIVPPRSKSSVRITLQGKDKSQARPFVVRSTQVNEGLKIEEITREIFKKETGYMVDEVVLDVFEVREIRPMFDGESDDYQLPFNNNYIRTHVQPIEVQPHELRFPFMASDRMSVSVVIKAVNNTDDYLSLNPFYGAHNLAEYYTYPEGAILAPRSTQTLEIIRTAKKDVPQSIECNDKYFILSTAISKDFNITSLEKFYKETREDPKWHEIELGVVLAAAYDGMPEVCPSAPRELIQVKQDEVRFMFVLQKTKYFSITLVNITEDTVAFITKVKHDEVSWYKTEPKLGILRPCSTLELLVSMDLERGKTVKDLPCNDKFYVYSSIVSHDFKASDLKDKFLITQVGQIWYRVDRDIVHVSSSLPTSWSILSDIKNIKGIDIHPTEPRMLITLHFTSHIYILNYHTEERTEVMVGPHRVRVAKFIPSKQWIVAGDTEGDIYVYSYDPINKIRVLKEHKNGILFLAVHPTEPYMLSTCESGKIVLWDIGKDWRVKKTFQTDISFHYSAFGPKDSNIFAFTYNRRFVIKIWNRQSGERMVELSGHSYYPSCFDYFSHGDELYMITGSEDKTAKIWDCVTGACVQTLQGHTGGVTTVCCHPDLPLLITGSLDGTVCLWNSTNFSLERVLHFDLGFAINVVACLKGTTRIAIVQYGRLVVADIGPEEPCA